MDILTIAGLGKAFGSQSVLDDLSFSVHEGSIYGFIGKNGSGKTTTKRFKGEKGPMCFIECNDTTNPFNVQFFQKKDPSGHRHWR